MEDSKQFIVSVDRGRFLRTFDGRVVTSTEVPSDALLMGYTAALSWVQRLRAHHYPEAMVCDGLGRYMSYERLQEVLRASRAQAASLPSSHEELDKIPAAELRKRYKTDANFAQRYDEIMAQPRVAPGIAK